MATVRTQRDQPALEIHRFPQRYASDFRRVITRPFIIGGVGRVYSVLDRVMRLDESEVETLLEEVYAGFSDRHANIVAVFEEHYRQAMAMLPDPPSVTPARRLLLGSYFSMEYSIEAAALFNPSITPHPDQADLPEGAVRFVLSLRATGEGHLSSIVFRTGLLHADGELSLDPLPRHIARTRVATDKRYDKALFRRKLDDMHLRMDLVDAILHRLDDQFTLDAMEQAIHGAMAEIEEPLAGHLGEVADAVRWLAHANYTLRLPSDAAVSDLVIFPHTENESRGIEDLRLVRFTDDDGSVRYFGTYTAYNGYHILPQLLETTDFREIGIHTLNGAAALNKGMALFPRKIGGHYVVCSRIDGESLYISYSDYPTFWESAELLRRPHEPWEAMQIGNCGSPIETDEGWLLLTHGVGPMRRYCIGALLLDRDDPLKVIGSLRQPLLVPTSEERDGYVPNVVYTCGVLAHAGRLFIPYAMSDQATAFASVALDPLLDRLVNGG